MNRLNKDREEFEKLMNNLAHTVKDNKTASEAIHTIWSWIETHTTKKVEESKTELLEEILGLEELKEEPTLNNFDIVTNPKIAMINIAKLGRNQLRKVIKEAINNLEHTEQHLSKSYNEPKELSNSNKQLKTRINKKLIPVVKTMQTKPNLCKSKDLKCENCKWFTDNRSDHCNFCLNKNEFKSKDKLGDDFSKFLEDEGYTVIDIK